MMTRRIAKIVATTLAAIAVPTLAFAHTGVGATTGFMQGFGHPISGLDHILAMVMVGVFGFQIGGRALWLVPSTFVLAMAAGGALGMMGIAIPLVETGVALSVLVLAAIVALDIKASAGGATAVVGLFAIFHGHAHGTEMPENVGGAVYALGFMIVTALLHVGGIALGFIIHKTSERGGQIVRQSAGGIAAIAGVGLLTGQL